LLSEEKICYEKDTLRDNDYLKKKPWLWKIC